MTDKPTPNVCLFIYTNTLFCIKCRKTCTISRETLVPHRSQNVQIKRYANLTDCQSMLQKYSKYIVSTDLGELIVPCLPTDKTWSDVIEDIYSPVHSISAFSI